MPRRNAGTCSSQIACSRRWSKGKVRGLPSNANKMKSEYDFRGAKRGAILAAPRGKTRITIRLDTEILDWFRDQVERAGGGNYQTLINEVLRRHVENSTESFEKTLRRVIREELRRLSASLFVT